METTEAGKHAVYQHKTCRHTACSPGPCASDHLPQMMHCTPACVGNGLGLMQACAVVQGDIYYLGAQAGLLGKVLAKQQQQQLQTCTAYLQCIPLRLWLVIRASHSIGLSLV